MATIRGDKETCDMRTGFGGIISNNGDCSALPALLTHTPAAGLARADSDTMNLKIFNQKKISD